MFVISSQLKLDKNEGLYFGYLSDNLGIKDVDLSSCMKFSELKDARNKLKEICERCESENCKTKLGADGISCVVDAWRKIYYKIIAEDSIPYHDSWNNAFPIDSEHIPDINLGPVIIVPKDGYAKKSQVSGDFLTNLMLKGYFYLGCDGYNRWEYNTDEKTKELYNIWLKYK